MGPVVRAKLDHDALEMFLDGIFGDCEVGRNDLVSTTAGESSQDPKLSGR